MLTSFTAANMVIHMDTLLFSLIHSFILPNLPVSDNLSIVQYLLWMQLSVSILPELWFSAIRIIHWIIKFC